MTADHIFTNAAVWQPATAAPANTVAVTGALSRKSAPTSPGSPSVPAPRSTIWAGKPATRVHRRPRPPRRRGLAALRCDLSELAHDRRGYLAAIAEYARTHPDEPVISGSGWYGDAFPGVCRRSRIRRCRRRPPGGPVQPRRTRNGRIQRRCNTPVSTPTPRSPGGRIDRDEHGEPTGVLFERAFDPVNALIPADGPGRLREALLTAQQRLHSVGVTGWQDAGGVFFAFGLTDTLDTYLAADAAGELTARCAAHRGGHQKTGPTRSIPYWSDARRHAVHASTSTPPR